MWLIEACLSASDDSRVQGILQKIWIVTKLNPSADCCYEHGIEWLTISIALVRLYTLVWDLFTPKVIESAVDVRCMFNERCQLQRASDF